MTEEIVLGGGCFWCTEAAFKEVDGVKSVTSGYAGGHTENPSYREVCSGDTGHAEVVKIEYSKEELGLEEILEFFSEFMIQPLKIGKAQISAHNTDQ